MHSPFATCSGERRAAGDAWAYELRLAEHFYKLVKKRLDSSTRSATGTYQEQTEKIIVLPGPAILAPPRVYALCLGTSGTALFTALDASEAKGLRAAAKRSAVTHSSISNRFEESDMDSEMEKGGLLPRRLRPPPRTPPARRPTDPFKGDCVSIASCNDSF
ncbi:hypothetical protein EVAR_38974_1 [Eumeta japonica]|uniref:Uncharacterized protein n=1 Tax=Eumeta variegata TaxID=151549 RepID=A0A4C1WA29_EUMVA|nr:hypothetical protein EVAR_38974_1 [Eumeta japonica]